MKNSQNYRTRGFQAGLLLLGLTMPGFIYATPLTDAFADRQNVEGNSAAFTGNNSSAGREVCEPDCGGLVKKTLWGAWTAPDAGTVTIATTPDSVNTVLAVYVGASLCTLQPVAQNKNVQSGFAWSSVTFPTKAGIAYSFVVDGEVTGSAGVGQVTVNINFTPQTQPGAEAGTDGFDQRPTLSGTNAIGICNNIQATNVFNEPPPPGQANKVWWRWVAPVNGPVTLDTLASDFNTILTVYTGNILTNLTEVAMNDQFGNVDQSSIAFDARAGLEYQIMVNGAVSGSAGEGNIILHLSQTPDGQPGAVPGGDLFANRGILGGQSARGVVNNSYFGLDPSEPDFGSPVNRTAWWQWTAPSTGPVIIKTEGSEVYTFLGVYTGTSVSGLQLVTKGTAYGNAHWSLVQFTAQAGTAYQIMVDGAVTGTHGVGNIALSIDQTVSTANVMTIYPAVELEMPGVLGVSYQLQSSPDLLTWENVGTPSIGAGAPIHFLDSTRGTNKKFFRYLTLQ